MILWVSIVFLRQFDISEALSKQTLTWNVTPPPGINKTSARVPNAALPSAPSWVGGERRHNLQGTRSWLRLRDKKERNKESRRVNQASLLKDRAEGWLGESGQQAWLADGQSNGSTMDSGRSLAQVIMELQNEIKKLETENKELRGELKQVPVESNEENTNSIHSVPDNDSVEDNIAHTNLRRNVSAPALEGQFKGKLAG